MSLAEGIHQLLWDVVRLILKRLKRVLTLSLHLLTPVTKDRPSRTDRKARQYHPPLPTQSSICLLVRVLPFTAYAIKCRTIISTLPSLFWSSVIVSWYLPTFVLPISRTVVIRSNSPSGFRLALSLNRPDVGNVVRDGRSR